MRDIHEYIDNRIGRVMDFVDARMYATSRFTYISKSSADGDQDFVQGQPNNPNEQGADDPVARLGGGGWGLAAVPPAGEPCLVVRAAGGVTNGIIAAVGSKRYQPANMSDGDVSLYCKQSGVSVYLKASDGSVTISDKSGSSQIAMDGSGNVSIKGNGSPASVKLGAAPIGDVLIKTLALDSLGVPVTQASPVNVQAG